MSTTATKLLLLVALCGVLASAAAAGEADDQFAVAAGHYSAKRWDLAHEEFRAFLRANPDHTKRGKAMFFQGEALAQLGRHADAYPLFVDLLAEQPTGPYAKQALFRAAEAAVLSGKLNEAHVRLSQFQSKYPADKLNAKVLMYRAEMALAAGELAYAERSYREAVERFADLPTADECRLALAHILESQKQPEAALGLLRDVAGHDHSPWTEIALLDLAARELAAKKPQAALELYQSIEKRIPTTPWLPQAHLGCGRAMYELGQFSESQKMLQPLTAHKELGNDARYWVALAQKAEKQYAAAAKTLDPALQSVQVRSNAKADAASMRRDPKIETTSPPRSDIAVVEKSVAGSTSPDAAAVDKSTPPRVTDKVANLREEQNRRRSAAIRYQAAESMIRAGDFGRAIATLEIGDNSGDDPRSLANRYLLVLALQGAQRNDEALTALDELGRTLTARLSAALSESAGATAADANPVLQEDIAALRTLNDNVQLAKATSLVAREMYAEAIEPLQIYLATPRKEIGAERAQSALAACFARTNRAEEARQALESLRSNHPQSQLIIPTTQHVAEAAYAAGQYQVAAEMFAALAADGNPPEMMARGVAGVAWCHFQAGDNEAAEAAFARFLEQFPTDARAAEVALARAQTLDRLQQDQQALAAYRQVLKRYPKGKHVPQVLAAAARLYDRLGQDDEAVPMYQRLVREFPDSAELDAALYGWAWSLRDLGRGNESDKVFRQLHEGHPQSRFWADATFRLAERAAQRGEEDVADGLLQPLVEGPCVAAVLQHALYLQGQVAINSQRWANAEAPLERLIQEFPQGALRLAAEFWLAEIAYRCGDYPLAQDRFDMLAPRVTNQNETWVGIVPLRRAQILAQNKQWSEARAVAETIVRDFPQFDQQFEADYLIGRCLAAEADFDGARAAYQRVVRSVAGGKTETAAMAQWMIGESYFHQENYPLALREYLRVETLYPYPRWQAAALLQAAKCQEQLGGAREASELYARLLQRFPHTEFVGEASKRLMDHTRR